MFKDVKHLNFSEIITIWVPKLFDNTRLFTKPINTIQYTVYYINTLSIKV